MNDNNDDNPTTTTMSLEKEHQQRLTQLLQYIAIVNTGTSVGPSNSSVSATNTDVNADAETENSGTLSKRGKSALSNGSNDPITTGSRTGTSLFVQRVVLPVPTSSIPPYFFHLSHPTNGTTTEKHPDTLTSGGYQVNDAPDDTSTTAHKQYQYRSTGISSPGTTGSHVIFTTATFRDCLYGGGSGREGGGSGGSSTATTEYNKLSSSLPFAFYGSATSTIHDNPNNNTNNSHDNVNTNNHATISAEILHAKKKHRVTNHTPSNRSNISGSSSSTSSSSHCWLRLTRLSATTTTTGTATKHHQHGSTMTRILEPIYNRLFEYIQQNENQHWELLWGLGHAYYIIPPSATSSSDTTATVINGPLLEVPIEVELGKQDGAIYLRPKQLPQQSSSSRGGGVRINRDVLTAILRSSSHTASSSSSSSSKQNESLLQSWYRKVQNDIDIAQISPAQPESYRGILQQMAVELLSNGIFIDSMTATTATSSSSNNYTGSHNHLPLSSIDPQKSCIITDTWCLYTSNKPTSTLSRDALAFVDRISNDRSFVTLKDCDDRTPHPSQYERLPPATWAITHGPGSYERYRKQVQDAESQRNRGNGFIQWIRSTLVGNTITSNRVMKSTFTNLPPKISLPLPSTEAQHRILDMLLYQNYPCVVVEGPPGTGKSQTICNMICAYLRVGKRILVTSKHSSSLSVIRKRLPKTIQELCIDVSNSEYNGVRQLQQTVERLSNRLASSTYQQQQQQQLDSNFGGMSQASTNTTIGSYIDSERDKLLQMQKLIDEHEHEVLKIDDIITSHYKRVYQLLQSTDGKQYMKLAIELLATMPWLMSTIASWTPYAVMKLRDQIAVFLLSQINDPIVRVCNYPNPPSNALLSLAASKAEMKIHVAANVTKHAIASIPFVGSWSGMDQHTMNLEKDLSMIRIGDHKPATPDDWSIVVRALRRAQAIHSYGQGVWKTYEHSDLWPSASDFFSNHDNVRDLHTNLCKAVEMKYFQWKLNITDMIAASAHCQSLAAQRCILSKEIQALSEEVVNLTVVTELCRSLSEEALSALIRFSQIAGKAKFHKPNIPVAKMSQRQRRHRDDYLQAFDQCCRYIPCWILTTSQISDFLPPEPLFDLVIIDETSQSDITVLPTMLRGKQWLIVGDGKQVSPTETFIAEEQMDHLRAIIPQCFFESALLPGQSFFDLCAQAFPTSRVVLNEHFRCASEIIAFSNENFYDGQLIPLRLPTQSERITPSIIDVRITKGTKVGKINEREADEIVRRVAEIVESRTIGSQQDRRSIGIISLMGDEQSRLIRGRLLDTIGPQRMAQHSVLVGDPPSFQGTERDIIFLSMVCSSGRAPTQSQLVHSQRANVAMSRARDQCILVRSLDISDIPSADDVKIPIIEFFQKATDSLSTTSCVDSTKLLASDAALLDDKNSLRNLLVKRLIERGYTLCCMGVVWNNGVCVEHPACDERVALIIDDVSETYQDWVRSYRQQQKIEGVGWKCLRIDVLSFLSDCKRTMQSIFEYLKMVGICTDVENKIKLKDAADTGTAIATMNIQNCDAVMAEMPTSSTPHGSSGSSSEQSDKLLPGITSTATGKTIRGTKRPRKTQNSKVKQEHVDLIDVAGAEVESLISMDSQSNSNEGNIVVDLSFLRGR